MKNILVYRTCPRVGPAWLLFFLLIPRPGLSQSSLRWKVPEPVQRVELGPENRNRQVRLADDGLATAVPIKFFMIGHAQVSIEATLPEPGRFEVKLLNEKALVDLKNVRVEGKLGRAEIVARAPPMSADDAWAKARGPVDQIQGPVRQRILERANSLSARAMRDYIEAAGEKAPGDEKDLRDAYAQAKADEETADRFEADTHKLIAERPKWFRRDIEERLRQGQANARRIYQELAALRLAEDYLERFGFQLSQRQTNYATYADRVKGRLEAVYQVVSGKLAQGEKRAVDAGELAKLREALLVDLECRLYAETDPQDPNAHWFNAQRVVCQASGIKTIKVSGRLDPAHHDRADWWILEKYAATVSLDASGGDGYRIEPPFKTEERAVLRVVATGEKAVDYSFQLTLTAKDRGLEVLLYESPARADAKFPF